MTVKRLTNAEVDALLADLLTLPKQKRLPELRRRYFANELGGATVYGMLAEFGERYLRTAPRTHEEKRDA